MGGVIQQLPQQQKEAVMSPSAAGTLYPDLMDYTIISMPRTPQTSVTTTNDLQLLLPQAKQLSELLQTNVGALETMVLKSAKGTVTISSNHALIKIGRPTEWVCVCVCVCVYVCVRERGGGTSLTTSFCFAPPSRYNEGDIVLFHPVRLHRSKSTAPVMLHLEKPRPYMFMDHTSYAAFNIRPGRMLVEALTHYISSVE